jgi:transcriptional regulator GlxA family with amidase domain
MDGIGKLEPSESDDQTVLPRHVKRALDYLNSNLAEKITLAELASACAAAERTLLKQFPEICRCSTARLFAPPR